MQLTKSQKDALVRKAMGIINEKMEAKREELRKDYKPSKETTEFLSRVKKFFEARETYYKIVKELGFKVDTYSMQLGSVKQDIDIPIQHYKDSDMVKYEDVVKQVEDKELGNLYNKKYTYPTEYEIMDELELSGLSKSFDIDAFLAKYQNL